MNADLHNMVLQQQHGSELYRAWSSNLMRRGTDEKRAAAHALLCRRCDTNASCRSDLQQRGTFELRLVISLDDDMLPAGLHLRERQLARYMPAERTRLLKTRFMVRALHH